RHLARARARLRGFRGRRRDEPARDQGPAGLQVTGRGPVIASEARQSPAASDCRGIASACFARLAMTSYPTVPSSARRSTLPGSAPVWLAASTTTVPLTITVVRLPLGY